jgi:hypothetical protein
LPTYLLVGIFDFNNTTHKQKHTTEHQERHHEKHHQNHPCHHRPVRQRTELCRQPANGFRSEAASLQKIGVVSSGGFTTLDDLVASLDMKAADAGATHYRITSATGMNKLSGTAVLYR